MNIASIKKNIEIQIAKLQLQLHYLDKKNVETSENGTWVIDTRSNTYYQFLSQSVKAVSLIRKGQKINFTKETFISFFKKANESDIKQHLIFLKSIGQKQLILDYSPKLSDQRPQTTDYVNSKNLDFYMVTVTGEHGSKVRHESYEVAEKEAIRLATKKNHEAFIVGVVASVKPKTETVTTVTYEVVKR